MNSNLILKKFSLFGQFFKEILYSIFRKFSKINASGELQGTPGKSGEKSENFRRTAIYPQKVNVH